MRDKVFMVTVYLECGQTIVLDHVDKFEYQRGGGSSKVTWSQTAEAETVLNTLDPDQIAAFTSSRQR